MSAVLAVALAGVLAMARLASATDAPASSERPESGAVIYRLGAAAMAPPPHPARATPPSPSVATTSAERVHEILTTLESRINGQTRDLAEVKTYLAAMLQVLELLRIELAPAAVARGGALPPVPKAPDTAAVSKAGAPGLLKIAPVIIPAPAPGGGG